MPSNPDEQIRRAAKEREKAKKLAEQVEAAERKARCELFPKEVRQALSRLEAKGWPGAYEVQVQTGTTWSGKSKAKARAGWRVAIDGGYVVDTRWWYFYFLLSNGKLAKASFPDLDRKTYEEEKVFFTSTLPRAHRKFPSRRQYPLDFALLSPSLQQEIIANVQQLGR
jgi:hypothetical protein